MSQSLSEKFKFSFKLRNSNSGDKMPSKKQYNLVQNDDYDTRVPLHSEEAFHHGITFQAKYIGTLDVPRPTSRVEIVAAMRRIRYEFKAKGVKKKKVSVEISVDGVRVTLKKKKKKKENKWHDPEGDSMELMHHPIYRIFYVSHDSSDLKIFSYIARDGVNNVFKCNVFKSNKKSQAMRIVRTVGQAFEVCHKLSPEPPAEAASSSAACDLSQEAALSISDKCSEISDKSKKENAGATAKIFDRDDDSDDGHHQDLATKTLSPQRVARPCHLDVDITPVPVKTHNEDLKTKTQSREPTPSFADRSIMTTPQSTEHREKLLAESLEQQKQQTRAATAQLAMLNDQLTVEKAARVEAQARTHQLLLHNKELIDHISMLVAHLQERERGGAGPLPYTIGTHQLTCIPQPRSPRDMLELGAGAGARCRRESPPRRPPALALGSLASLLPEPNNNSPGPYSPLYPAYAYPATPADVLDRQNANDLTDFLIDLVNRQSPNEKKIPASPRFQTRQMYASQRSSLLLTPDDRTFSATLRPEVEDPMSAFLRLSNDAGRSYENPSVLSREERPQSPEIQDDACAFIRPLSQIGTVTTLDEEGRVRIVVPSKKSPQPIISRTTSERVPNKNVLMAQVRDQWGRHTTK